MSNTYVKLNTYTVDSNGVNSFTFNNIPQSYTDLVLHISAASNGTNATISVAFNGGTKDYTAVRITMSGTGNWGAGGSFSGPFISYANPSYYTGTVQDKIFSSSEIYIPNYTSSRVKNGLAQTTTENNANFFQAYPSSWYLNNPSPITSITLFPTIDPVFLANSTFTLYGVSSAVKAVGGVVNISGGYVYHTFTSSGIFTPNRSLSTETLIVAGGGGGAGTACCGVYTGGGGAGGVNAVSAMYSANYGYPVIIGSGGTGGNIGFTTLNNHNSGTTGNSSSVGTLIAIGGGAGGGIQQAGGRGGSGGGGGGYSGTVPAGVGTTGQGNNGGVGGGGGGGGFAAAGGRGIADGGSGGTGGAGSNTWSSWFSAVGQSIGASGFIAGGGGGGGNTNGYAGGAGGGGAAGNLNANGTSGTALTGGGGGGAGISNSSASSNGGSGGSGFVIIRYLA